MVGTPELEGDAREDITELDTGEEERRLRLWLEVEWKCLSKQKGLLTFSRNHCSHTYREV